MAETVENWVSLRRFAAARGVSLAAVQRAIADGRLKTVKRDPQGRLKGVELAAGMREWNGNTDLDQAQRAGAPILVQTNTPPARGGDLLAAADRSLTAHDVEVAGTGTSAAAGELPGAGAPDTDEARYLKARAERQQIEAREAEIRYLQALGRLVSVDELQTVSARRYAAIRDKLLNIPDRVATILAAERDPARVHAALTTEIKQVLNELADHAAASAAAAEGTAERVAA